MKRLIIALLAALLLLPEVHAVLKEKDLEQTLQILRNELTDYHRELMGGTELRKQQNQQLINQLINTMKQANQNALMLYSQHKDYVFDLTYACHEATEQYRSFRQQQLPFRSYMELTSDEVAKYDSLCISLKELPQTMLTDRGRINRNVCLTLATSISNTLKQSQQQMADYQRYYQNTEQRLKTLNDYAQVRYNEIQTSIFRNGSESYFSLLRHLPERIANVGELLSKKYGLSESASNSTNEESQWSLMWIFGLFVVIIFYAVVAVVLNQLAFRFLLPRRFRSKRLQRKRAPIILATTMVTFAIIMGVVTATSGQNFLVMASNLLVEFAWLVSVIIISLLLRVEAEQVKSAFRIYAPLIAVTFIIITFRIVLVPSELVNMLFPAVLLCSTFWQWLAIRHNNHNVPRSDMFYTYISLVVFLVSLVCSWGGYTLLAVQQLIWWTMQLTCILTITCISGYVRQYGRRHNMSERPVTQTWLYQLFYSVLLPILTVISVMFSIYWAAGVFSLDGLSLELFKRDFVQLRNLKLSVLKVTIVVCLWFFFRYLVQTILSLMRMHYHQADPANAASREVMGRNVIQVIVWGAWLLISLSILDVSVTWLLAIGGGLSTGIGFASKDIIENIYYGASLMAGRIKVGDWIQIDGTMGKVASISYTSTVVESLYGEVITYQNSQLFAKNYKNLTRNHGYILAPVEFSVAYGSNLHEVTQLVEQAVNSLHHTYMDSTKTVNSVVYEMGDSSVNFRLYVWADAVKKVYVVSDVLKCIYDTLAAHHIEIPFPQRDVHIKQ